MPPSPSFPKAIVVTLVVAACACGTIEVGGSSGGEGSGGQGSAATDLDAGAVDAASGGDGGTGANPYPPEAGWYWPDGGDCDYSECGPNSGCSGTTGLCCGGWGKQDVIGCLCGDGPGCYPPAVCCALPGAFDWQCVPTLEDCPTLPDDDGTTVPDAGSGGPPYKPCTTKADCPHPSDKYLCEQGICCSGDHVVDGICYCGSGPDCGLLGTCCYPNWEPTVLTCLSSDYVCYSGGP